MKIYKGRIWLGAILVLSLLAGAYPPALTLADTLPPSTPAPDLIIQTITWSPEIPLIGNTVTFTVTIKNQGNGQAGASDIAYHIDEVYQTLAPVNPINSGATATEIFTWTAQTGSHNIKAVADHNNSVSESDEANNDKTFAFSVLAPDLVIDEISYLPLNPLIGDKVDFTVTIKNQGNSKAGVSNVDFYVDGSSRGYREVLGIEAGATVTKTFTWVAQAGSHAIQAVADVLKQVTEGNEANNGKVLVFSTLAPDLIINTITWSPSNFSEGDYVNFMVTIVNQGLGKAEYSHVAYYVDDSAQTSEFVNQISPGDTTTSNFTWKAQAGFHTLRAVADSDNSLLESDETNNAKSITVPNLAPDLIIQDITCSPATPIIAQPVDFRVSVKNQGSRKAGNSRVYLFIDVLNKLQQDIYEIDAGATVTVIFTWTPRAAIQTIKAVADGENYVTESYEANNTKTIQITASRPTLSDLMVQGIVYSPVNPSIGDPVTLNVTIRNQGVGLAGASHVAYYTDNTCLTEVYVNQIEPGTTATTTCTWAAQAGSHVIRAVVDPNNTIAESSETNNEKSVTLSVSAPDLVIRDITWSPVSPSTGETVNFIVTIENRGNNGASRSYVAYYIDGSSRGNNDVPEMDAGAIVIKTFTWTAQAGSHAIKTYVDMENQIPEGNESNNEKTVSVPAPDLIIDALTWSPLNPSKDDSVTFSVTIKNRGSGRAEPSSVAFDIDGSAQDYENIQEIEAGATATKTFVWEAQAGSHTARVIADGLNQIFESNESNNEQSLSLSVALPSVTTPEPAPEPAPPSKVAQLDSQSSQASPVPGTVQNLLQKSSPTRSKESRMHWWLVSGVTVLGVTVIAVMLRSRQRPR